MLRFRRFFNFRTTFLLKQFYVFPYSTISPCSVFIGFYFSIVVFATHYFSFFLFLKENRSLCFLYRIIFRNWYFACSSGGSRCIDGSLNQNIFYFFLVLRFWLFLFLVFRFYHFYFTFSRVETPPLPPPFKICEQIPKCLIAANFNSSIWDQDLRFSHNRSYKYWF